MQIWWSQVCSFQRYSTYKYFYDDLKTSKIGQGDLVFGVRSGCTSVSAHTRWHVSVYTSYDLCHPGCSRNVFVHFDLCNPDKLVATSDHVRLLGVTILSDLSSEKHVSITSSTCFYWLRQLRRIRQSLNTESLKTLVHPSSHLVLTTVTLCWPGRQSPILTGYSGCWTRQLVSSVAPGSLTVAWRSYVTLSCIGWAFLTVSSISLEWPSTGVFKAGRPSTSWTAAHLLRMSPAISVFALPAATSSSFHDIIAACSAVGHSLLSARWPGTLSLTISTTQSLVMTSLEQHWRHTFLQVSEHVAH